MNRIGLSDGAEVNITTSIVLLKADTSISIVLLRAVHSGLQGWIRARTMPTSALRRLANLEHKLWQEITANFAELSEGLSRSSMIMGNHPAQDTETTKLSTNAEKPQCQHGKKKNG